MYNLYLVSNLAVWLQQINKLYLRDAAVRRRVRRAELRVARVPRIAVQVRRRGHRSPACPTRFQIWVTSTRFSAMIM